MFWAMAQPSNLQPNHAKHHLLCCHWNSQNCRPKLRNFLVILSSGTVICLSGTIDNSLGFGQKTFRLCFFNYPCGIIVLVHALV